MLKGFLNNLGEYKYLEDSILEILKGGLNKLYIEINIIIIYYLTSDSDPYQAYADYSLYTYREKTLFKKTLFKKTLFKKTL